MPRTLLLSGEARSPSIPANSTAISLLSIIARPLSQSEEVMSLAFSPKGDLLAVGGAEGEIRIYDARTRRLLQKLRGKSNQIFALAWSPDGTKLFNSKGEMWDRGSWRIGANLSFVPATLKQPTLFFNDALSWRRDGQMIASGGSFRTVFRAVTKDTRILFVPVLLEQSNDWIRDMDFSSDGRFLAEGGPNHFSVWDARALLERRKLVEARRPARDPNMERAVERFRVLQKQKQLSPAEKEEKKELLSSLLGVMRKEMSALSGSVKKVAFSPDSKFLAVAYSGMAEDAAGRDGKIVVWDTNTWDVRFRFDLPGASASALAWSPDSRLLAGSEGELAGFKKGVQKHLIRVWDAQGGRLTFVLSGSTDHINALAWSPDGATLTSGGRDQNLRLWPIPRAGATR